MINNYIRGGQIFLHKIRMLKQVWDNTLLLSFIMSLLITSYISYDKFLHLDYNAGLTYIKALTLRPLDKIFNKSESIRIAAISDQGTYSKNIMAKDIIKHQGFKKRYDMIVAALINYVVLAATIMCSFSIVIIYLWNKFGKISNNRDITKGRKIQDAKEVSKYLKSQGKASDFTVGGMNLVKDAETSHILITGTTGSGKTTCINEILPQIRKKNQSAVIIDYTGLMTRKYYDEQRGDIIISYNEIGSYAWDFWEDVKDDDNLSIIANALFSNKGSKHDEMWNNASIQFFKDAVKYIAESDSPTIAKLYKFLTNSPLAEIHHKLKDYPSHSIFDPNNEKTAMSVRTNTIAFIDWMENFKELPRKISIARWFNEERLSKASWIFLKSTPKQRVKIRCLYSILLDLAINQIMELGEDRERRIWMIIDELPSLKKLPSLETALSEFRKYGCSIIASLQSPHQLFELYGGHAAYAMLDQFNTKFIFRTDEYNFASYLCKGFGEVEYKEQNENYSYGAHEMRDGVSISHIDRQKPLLTPDDLASLENLEGYVKLPLPGVRIAKIRIKS